MGQALTSDGSTYTYDANGNALSKSGEAYYTVNEENRLSQVQLTNGSTIQHTYDADGNRVKTVEPSPPAAATACSGNSASFVRKDTTTQGNWIGTYGVDGDYINALTAQPPSYGTVTFTGTSNFTWASSTTDVQALEDQPPGTSRIASTWYSGGTETFSVVTTDGNEHTVALYLLDWDGGRAETVTAETPTGTVLSSAEAFSNFTGGQYAVYTICGSVNFVVTLTAGANAVVSGVFFGGAPGAATTTSSLVDTGNGLSQVVGETNASNALTALYVRAGDELLSVIRPNGTGWTQHFIHKDGLGSVRTITDDNGNIVDTRGYEAFGTKNSEAGSEPLAYGFAGEPLDSTTHLAYHRARWMDSRVGRFTGMDPLSPQLQQPGTYHAYLYAGDTPTMAVDPTGQEPFELLFGKAIEQQIFADFLDKVPGGVTNTAIQNILGGWSFNRSVNPLVKAFFGVGLLGRPDLANPWPPIPATPYIFEVKPLSQEWVAELEVDYYLSVLNALDDRPTKWRGGTAFDYNPPASLTVLGVTVNTWVADDGVIAYYAYPTQAALVRASAIISVGAAIGVAMLVADTEVAVTVNELE